MGNFPVRMLVILVKLCKLVELKKQFIVNLTTMNEAAEKMNLYDNKYPPLFKVIPLLPFSKQLFRSVFPNS